MIFCKSKVSVFLFQEEFSVYRDYPGPCKNSASVYSWVAKKTKLHGWRGLIDRMFSGGDLDNDGFFDQLYADRAFKRIHLHCSWDKE